MIEEQTNTGISKVSGSSNQSPVVTNNDTHTFIQKVLKHVMASLKAVFYKIYLKKKIFFPLIVIVCLLMITIILVFIFSNIKIKQTISINIPNPQFTDTPKATGSANIITTTEKELKELGSQIKSFDVYQYKLQPPTIDFEIEF